ncbi:hypothetical protein D3C86_1827700 [compost metagenome]
MSSPSMRLKILLLFGKLVGRYYSPHVWISCPDAREYDAGFPVRLAYRQLQPLQEQPVLRLPQLLGPKPLH